MVARSSRKANRVGKANFLFLTIMKNLFLISFCFFLASAQAQFGNMFTLWDNLQNPLLWTQTNSGTNGAITVAVGGIRFNASGCGSGNGQFATKNIPAFTGGGGISPTSAPNQDWIMDFDFDPTSYAANGTAHLLMALTDNPNVHPIQTNANFLTTNSDVVGVMLTSALGSGANSEIGIWVKDGNNGGNNNVVCASNGTNTFATTSTPIGASGGIIGITNGIPVPILATSQRYHIRLQRTAKNITLTLFSGSTLLGTIIMILPNNVDPIAVANYTCANFPQGSSTRILSAVVRNVCLRWGVNSFFSISSNGPLSTVLSNISAGGPMTGYGYCLSQFTSASKHVIVDVPTFAGSTYLWTLTNSCQTQSGSPYTQQSATKLWFASPTSAWACPTSVNGIVWDYPYSISITNLPGNAPGNQFNLTGNSWLRVGPYCRISDPNAIANIVESPFKMFPNPTVDKLNLSGLSEMGIIHKLAIYNVSGQLVKQTQVESELSEMEVNVEELPSGVYFLKIESENADKIEKFVKE